MSNHTLGIHTKLSHVTNVISTYVDGSEQFLFDILWPHHDSADFISKYGSWHKDYEYGAVIVLGHFLPLPRVEIFLYDNIVGVLSDPGNEFRLSNS